jgi:hypothetical protein
MKKVIITLFVLSSSLLIKAQEASNQNPNYKISQAKYELGQEKVLASMGTTAQQTYKAYDWTEAKQESKQQRIQLRQQRALAYIKYSNQYPFYSFNGYNNPYNYLGSPTCMYGSDRFILRRCR